MKELITTVELEQVPEQLEVIVSFGNDGLIVNSEKTLGRLHKALYDRMDALLKQWNPCEITEDSCYCFEHALHSTPFCCQGCRYNKKKGCTVRSITCKFHLCHDMIEHRQEHNSLLPPAFLRDYFRLRRVKNLFFEHMMREPKQKEVRWSWKRRVGTRLPKQYGRMFDRQMY